MHTVVILSGISYSDALKQRPQHFAKFFKNEGFRTVYISITDGNKFNHNEINQIHTFNDILHTYFEKNNDDIFIVNKNNTQTNNLGLYALTKKLNTIRSDQLTIIVTFPEWMEYLDGISLNCKLIYDCLDDWESFLEDVDLNFSKSLLYKENKLASISDIVIVSSKRLFVKMAYLNNNIFYLPNGVWIDDYNHQLTNQMPNDLLNINKPIIFFMGAIAEWVDVELINFIAKSRPQYSFVFVGIERVPLPKLNNIYYLGLKKYEELPNYLKYSRVSIIPFKENNLTASVTPLKLYEYLSSGTPVISTMLPDIIGHNGLKVANNKEEFLEYIDYYVDLDENNYIRESESAGQIVIDYDWNKLLKPICNYIEGDNITIEKSNVFIEKTINTYKEYSSHPIIKNELINLYVFLEQYDIAVQLYEEDPLTFEKSDLEKIALAYYELGNVTKSIEIFRHFIKKTNKITQNYLNSILKEKDGTLLFKAYLLKCSGNFYKAIRFLDNLYNPNTLNSKLIGLLSGLYLDIGEYEIAFNLAVEAMEMSNGLNLELVLDPDVFDFLITYLINLNEYSLAEEIALSLMNLNEEWEEKAIKYLSEVYIAKNLV